MNDSRQDAGRGEVEILVVDGGGCLFAVPAGLLREVDIGTRTTQGNQKGKLTISCFQVPFFPYCLGFRKCWVPAFSFRSWTLLQ